MNKNEKIAQEYNLVLKAFLLMGKFLRKNPPSLDQEDIPRDIYFNILIGGDKRDPDGLEYCSYFLDQVKGDENNAKH